MTSDGRWSGKAAAMLPVAMECMRGIRRTPRIGSSGRGMACRLRWGLGCLSRSGGQGHAEERDDGQARSRGGGSRGGGARGAVAPVAGGRRRGRCDGPAGAARRAGGSRRGAGGSRRGAAGGSGRGARGRAAAGVGRARGRRGRRGRDRDAGGRPGLSTATRPRMRIVRPPSRTSAARASSARRSGRSRVPSLRSAPPAARRRRLRGPRGRESRPRGGERLRGDGRDDQHGAVGVVRHPVRDAAEHERAHAGDPARSQDDDGGVALVRLGQDRAPDRPGALDGGRASPAPRRPAGSRSPPRPARQRRDRAAWSTSSTSAPGIMSG